MTVLADHNPAVPAASSEVPLLRRLGAVIRIHFAGLSLTVIQPVLITALIFVVNIAIYGLIAYAAGDVATVESGAFQSGGGVTWVFVFMIVIAVQAMHFTFRFALGLSVARRDYYLGTLLSFLMLTLFHSAGLTVMAALERATDGWWLNSAFFAPMLLVGEPLWVAAYVYVVGFLLAFSTGAFAATTWVRWGSKGLYGYFTVITLAVVAFAWIVTVSEAWSSVWDFLAGTSVAALATWALPLVAIGALGGYLLIRRAPVRS